MKRCRAFTLTAAAVVALATVLLFRSATFGATPEAAPASSASTSVVRLAPYQTCAPIRAEWIDGWYVGHDEPSVGFKSERSGHQATTSRTW